MADETPAGMRQMTRQEAVAKAQENLLQKNPAKNMAQLKQDQARAPSSEK